MDDIDQQQKNSADKSVKRFQAMPRPKRVLLVAAAGIVIALLVGGAAWLLSGGDSSSLNKTAEGSNASAKGNNTTDAGKPQSPASNSNDMTGAAGNAGQTGGSTGSQASPPANPPASAVNTTPSAGSTITIANMAFSPASLTVAKNTTVTWKNNDTVDHAIDKADGQSSGPHSPQLKPGASYSYSFSTAGTYKYICVIHPSMSGTVIVKD